MKLEILDKRPEFQTDPAFYTNDGDHETVAIAFDKYQIVKCGEMRIDFESPDGKISLFTTGDLLDWGLDSDEMLASFEKQGLLVWENNPWFEIWVKDEETGTPDFVTDEPFFSIAEAYKWLETNLHDLQSHPVYDKFAWENEGRKKQVQHSQNLLLGMLTQTLSYVRPETTSISDGEFWNGWAKGVNDSIEKIRTDYDE